MKVANAGGDGSNWTAQEDPMPSSRLLTDAEQWRLRAEEMRTAADDMKDPQSNQPPPGSGSYYDRLAGHGERGSPERPQPSTGRARAGRLKRGDAASGTKIGQYHNIVENGARNCGAVRDTPQFPRP